MIDDLPALVSRLLWKLEALHWVEPVGGAYAITTAGVGALRGTTAE